ncbi:MAG TPA: EthD family reductase [Candidatus Binataceae bacterium]|nr:EthD family reductase [Candidatus Binataceae bacterium]
MHVMMVTFDFQGADLATEERHYRDVHMALAKQFTGVEMYLAGRIRANQFGFTPAPQDAVKPYRTAIMWFRNTQDFMNSVSSQAGIDVLADTQAHLTNVQMIHAEGEAVVPFDSRKAGQQCFLVAAHINYKPSFGTPEEAERHYLNVHTKLACGVAGLRGYYVGKTVQLGDKPDCARAVFQMYDDFEAFQRGMTSPAGQELLKDDARLISVKRLFFADAQVEQ